MHAIRPANVVAEREKSNVIDNRVTAGSIRAGVARAAHHVPGEVAGPHLSGECHELFTFDRFDHIVRIEPKRIITGRMRERFIPCRGEIIDPRRNQTPSRRTRGRSPSYGQCCRYR